MIAAQMPAERKRGQSQFIIENAGTLWPSWSRRRRRVFTALRQRAARAGVQRETPGQKLIAVRYRWKGQ